METPNEFTTPLNSLIGTYPANTKGEVSRIDERIDGNVTLLAEYKASIDENAAGIAAGAVRITDLEANLVSTKYVETIAVPSTVNLITHDLDDSEVLVTVYGDQPDTLTATSDDSTTVGLFNRPWQRHNGCYSVS